MSHASKPAPVFAGAFAESDDFDFEVRCAIGLAPNGGGDIGRGCADPPLGSHAVTRGAAIRG